MARKPGQTQQPISAIATCAANRGLAATIDTPVGDARCGRGSRRHHHVRSCNCGSVQDHPGDKVASQFDRADAPAVVSTVGHALSDPVYLPRRHMQQQVLRVGTRQEQRDASGLSRLSSRGRCRGRPMGSARRPVSMPLITPRRAARQTRWIDVPLAMPWWRLERTAATPSLLRLQVAGKAALARSPGERSL